MSNAQIANSLPSNFGYSLYHNIAVASPEIPFIAKKAGTILRYKGNGLLQIRARHFGLHMAFEKGDKFLETSCPCGITPFFRVAESF